MADDKVEPLITMDTPEEEDSQADYLQNITIPSALISKALGDNIKKALTNREMVNINLDWREALPHPDERVEYEFWTNSNDECGPKCESQIEFVKSFRGAAQILEQKGYTQFTPHYITWYCPEAFKLSKQCKSQCINRGRYCAPDPEQDFNKGYDGKDVVIQNLRQACLFKVANESGKPWIWWDYVTDFAIRCPMKEKKYTKECADQVIQSLGMFLQVIISLKMFHPVVHPRLMRYNKNESYGSFFLLHFEGLDLKEIDKCIGDADADVDNTVLKSEQDAQVRLVTATNIKTTTTNYN